MKLSDIKELLKNKEVIEEINKHLWIESQKVGYSIGIERATEEWLRLYAAGWIKHHMPDKYSRMKGRKKKAATKKAKKKATKKAAAKKKK